MAILGFLALMARALRAGRKAGEPARGGQVFPASGPDEDHGKARARATPRCEGNHPARLFPRDLHGMTTWEDGVGIRCSGVWKMIPARWLRIGVLMLAVTACAPAVTPAPTPTPTAEEVHVHPEEVHVHPTPTPGGPKVLVMRDPADVPPPIRRTEPTTVEVTLTVRELVAELADEVTFPQGVEVRRLYLPLRLPARAVAHRDGDVWGHRGGAEGRAPAR